MTASIGPGMDMLTESEKQKIRAEEIFREEVRTELASKQPARSRIWSFINTSFGLWFLTTVIIGLATWSYSTMQERKKSAANERELLSKLATELAVRVAGCLDEITSEENEASTNPTQALFSRSDLFRNVVGILDNVGTQQSGTFEEFAKSTFASLLVEQQPLVAAAKSAQIDHALRVFDSMKIEAEVKTDAQLSGGDILKQLKEIRSMVAVLQIATRPSSHKTGPH
jgi:hypothetical protein